MRKRPNKAIGHTIHKRNNGQGYCTLHVKAIVGLEADSAREYEESPSEYNLQRMQDVRSKGTSLKYLSGRQAFGMTWQVDREQMVEGDYSKANPWCGGSIVSVECDPEIIRLLGTVVKSATADGKEFTPRNVISRLGRLVTHHSYGSWVYQKDDDLDELLRPDWQFPENYHFDGRWWDLAVVGFEEDLHAIYEVRGHGTERDRMAAHWNWDGTELNMEPLERLADVAE